VILAGAAVGIVAEQAPLLALFVLLATELPVPDETHVVVLSIVTADVAVRLPPPLAVLLRGPQEV